MINSFNVTLTWEQMELLSNSLFRATRDINNEITICYQDGKEEECSELEEELSAVVDLSENLFRGIDFDTN